MTERYYSFAGVDITLALPEERFFTDDRALAPFVSEPGKDPHRFEFRFVESLTPASGRPVAEAPGLAVYDGNVRYMGSVQDGWSKAYLRAEHRGREHEIQVRSSAIPGRIGTHTVLGALGAEHLVLEAGGLVVHASYVLHNGKAILFTAPSGTGKSTQAELWKEHRGARIINGDRAVIRLEAGQAVACGIPFAGSSPYCENVTATLAAIVYLAQAPQTTISRLTGFRAFRQVWEGCSINTWNRADVEKAIHVVEQILERVPVYYLPCTPDASAIAALEGELP